MPGFTVSQISGDTSEDGTSQTFTVVLNTQPTDDVTIPLSSDDTTEGTVTGPVSPTSLTFTPSNWDTPQTVTVTGVDDPIVDGTIAYHVVLGTVSSSDINYNNLDPDDVEVNNLDNDNYSLSITKTQDGAEPSTNTTFEVTVTPTNNTGTDITGDIAFTGTAIEGTDYQTGPTSFSIPDGSSTTTITLTTIDDSIIEGDETITATISNPSVGAVGSNDSDTANLADNDTAGFTIGTITGDTSEDGTSQTFTVVLNTQPTNDVTIPLSSDDTTEGTVLPTSLTFTSTN